jgi:transposase
VNTSSRTPRWRREVRLRGPEAAFTPMAGSNATPDYEAQIAELERVCGHLAMENAALKKALQRLQSKPSISS